MHRRVLQRRAQWRSLQDNAEPDKFQQYVLGDGHNSRGPALVYTRLLSLNHQHDTITKGYRNRGGCSCSRSSEDKYTKSKSRAKLVPVERERDADRLDRALHPHRSERGEGPVRRRLRELGGVKAIVVGAFAEHSADVHELVDELAAAGAHKAAQKYLMPAHRAKGATKALLYAAFGASAWRALSALLHHRLAFIGAPGHRLGGGDALDRTRRRAEERSGVHTEAALQLLASPYGLRGFL